MYVLAVACLAKNLLVCYQNHILYEGLVLTLTQREYVRFKVMQVLESNPNLSQRELAEELGVSLGSVNYCVKSLVSKGLIKVKSFVKSNNKIGYSYYLTPQGIYEKSEMTVHFLKCKNQEFAMLKAEIVELQAEVEKSTDEKT